MAVTPKRREHDMTHLEERDPCGCPSVGDQPQYVPPPEPVAPTEWFGGAARDLVYVPVLADLREPPLGVRGKDE